MKIKNLFSAWVNYNKDEMKNENDDRHHEDDETERFIDKYVMRSHIDSQLVS